MGILNVTPDSFFDGGKHNSLDNALQHVEKMLLNGAHFIDVGGMSSRPGATIIPEEEELKRVIPYLHAITNHFPQTIISIDTLHARVAKECIAAGAKMVNDISAGTFDPNMLPVVGTSKIPFVAMHMQGTPANMQHQPRYANLLNELLDFFVNRIHACHKAGITDVIIDPGFGFGKTLEHNYLLLRHLPVFKNLNCPIMVGLSRKSMITRPLGITPQEALNGTTALHTMALLNGANILRVHDVKEAKQVITLTTTYNNTVL